MIRFEGREFRNPLSFVMFAFLTRTYTPLLMFSLFASSVVLALRVSPLAWVSALICGLLFLWTGFLNRAVFSRRPRKGQTIPEFARGQVLVFIGTSFIQLLGVSAIALSLYFIWVTPLAFLPGLAIAVIMWLNAWDLIDDEVLNIEEGVSKLYASYRDMFDAERLSS